MPINLNNLIDTEKNVYELTCVAIKEADVYLSTDLKDEVEKNGDKIVSVVLDKALEGEIKYTEGE
ncbi:MAG TPA: hypothetical protein IAB12_06025 [Candidatus Ornithospirochaeta avicola]|uniref:DNA-directed RNA polymerase subunit omega n=1 Tax=Candidatus Ornithospirochaeta avicola TaxID=2840896 RepID=A0A9D1TN49_9SPIO|nr:hypothetical protein [Candidatus Ornithospirochaeta avicola]